MASRTSSRYVTFRRPFWVSGLDCRQPAGTYTVDTEEQLVEAPSFQAWKHVGTVMRIPREGSTDYVRVNREELDDVLARDAEHPEEKRRFGEPDADYDLL